MRVESRLRGERKWASALDRGAGGLYIVRWFPCKKCAMRKPLEGLIEEFVSDPTPTHTATHTLLFASNSCRSRFTAAYDTAQGHSREAQDGFQEEKQACASAGGGGGDLGHQPVSRRSGADRMGAGQLLEFRFLANQYWKGPSLFSEKHPHQIHMLFPCFFFSFCFVI